MTDRTHDLVLLGATGFTGRLTARHLAATAPADARIALAGRSLDRLGAVRKEIGVDWPLIAVDSADVGGMQALASSTTAVATTVGPYARHGWPLVQACAESGTHYADLSGEVTFVRRSVDELHAVAQSSGARLVHSCGFDSVPSDLGVLLAAEQAAADGTGELTSASLVVRSIRGGFSGGTVDSMRLLVDTAKKDSAVRRLLADPYALNDAGGTRPEQPADGFLARRVDGRWQGPFVMAVYNTRVVRRSAQLRGNDDLLYDEAVDVGRSPASPVIGAGMAIGIGALGFGLAVPPLRFLLDKALPSPGEGPSEKTQSEGRFHTETIATTTSGARYRVDVRAQGDPGYAATAVMLGQSALALALDDLPPAAGVLTPATGIGVRLAERLRVAGFTLETTRLS